MTTYPIIANCNFESRDDAEGKAIHAARKAVETGRCRDAALIEALDDLESVLTDHADGGSERAVRICNEAERVVVTAWTSAKSEA